MFGCVYIYMHACKETERPVDMQRCMRMYSQMHTCRNAWTHMHIHTLKPNTHLSSLYTGENPQQEQRSGVAGSVRSGGKVSNARWPDDTEDDVTEDGDRHLVSYVHV